MVTSGDKKQKTVVDNHGDFRSQIEALVDSIPLRIQNHCLTSSNEFTELVQYNFKLKSKLVRPRTMISFAGLIDPDFHANPETVNSILNWACVIEMIHGSSLYHVWLEGRCT